MDSILLNRIGLILGFAGVVLIFLWGPPAEARASARVVLLIPIFAGGSSVSASRPEIDLGRPRRVVGAY